MSRLKIGVRLTISFALIILLMFLGSLVGLWQFIQLRQQAQYLSQVDIEVVAILQLNNSVLKLNNELFQLAETEEADIFSREADRLQTNVQRNVEETIRILARSQKQQPEIQYTIEQLANLKTLSNQVEQLIALAEEENWAEVQFRLRNQLYQISQITQELVDEIANVVDEEREEALENVLQAQQQAFTAVLITGLLTLLTAAILGFMVTRSITRSLALLDEGAKALAHRQFEHQIEIEGDDELAHLGQVFNNAVSEIAQLYNDLEDLVQTRTQELEQSSEELKRRYLQLETGIAVGQHITSILDLDTLLHQVVELIKERFGYYFVGVFLLDEEGQTVVARAGTGEAGRRMNEQRFALKVGEEGIIGWVAEHCSPGRVDDVSKDSRYMNLDIIPHTRSELALPLMMGQTMLGVLDIQSDQRHAFRMDDVPVWQSLADQVAIAIENASLYQIEKSRRQLAETLYHVGRDLSRTLDLQEVLYLVLYHLADIVPYDRAAIFLPCSEEKENFLEIVEARGYPSSIDPKEIRIPLDNDFVQQIYRRRQSLMIPDVQEHANWTHIEDLPPARAWLGIPLIRVNKVIGLLSLIRQTPASFTKEEIRLATTFIGQAAFALENARLYDNITRLSQQLEDRVRERTNELQVAYAQLTHLDRTKTEFINIAAHELRTPLTVLQGYSRMLMNDEQIKNNPAQLEMVVSIHSGAVRLHEVVNSMLDTAKIDSRALKLYPEPLAILSVIQVTCQKFTHVLSERNLQLDIEDMNHLPAIEADPDALSKVFSHLIGNAIKYTPDGGNIEISGQPVREQGIEVIIRDTGIGIDPEFHELIFTKFYQTGEIALHSSGRTKFKGGGPGLGLAIAQGIVEAHQGKVWVESEGQDEEKLPGSAFHIFLPLRQKIMATPE